jgi:hypothetical protein
MQATNKTSGRRSSASRTKHNQTQQGNGPEPQSSAGIPFFITQAMKAKLQALGYGDDAIAQMKPAEAHKIINGSETLRVAITFFPNQFAKSMKVETLSLQELADRIVSTTAGKKTDLPFVKLAAFNGKVNPVHPEKRCLRYDAGVVEITGIEGDKDAAPLGFDEASDKLEAAGLPALLYTSASHTEEQPRFRVICPTSRPLPPSERAELVARLNGVLDGALSGESFTLSQSYYFGRVKGKPAPRVRIIRGDRCIDQRSDLGAIGKASAKIGGVDYYTGSNWTEFASQQSKKPIDAVQLLDKMKAGDKDHSIHMTQLSLIAAGLCRGFTADEAIEPVLKRTMEVTPIPSEKTRKTQAKKLQGMVQSWLRKHPELKDTAYPTPFKIVAEAYGFPSEKTLECYDWLLGRHLLRGQVCGTAAGGGTGKSSISIVEALAMTSGKHLLHDSVSHKPLRVVLINLEDNRNTMDKRIIAAMKHHKLKPEDIGDRLIVVAKGEFKFKIAKQLRSGGDVERNENAITALANLMIEKRLMFYQSIASSAPIKFPKMTTTQSSRSLSATRPSLNRRIVACTYGTTHEREKVMVAARQLSRRAELWRSSTPVAASAFWKQCQRSKRINSASK